MRANTEEAVMVKSDRKTQKFIIFQIEMLGNAADQFYWRQY